MLKQSNVGNWCDFRGWLNRGMLDSSGLSAFVEIGWKEDEECQKDWQNDNGDHIASFLMPDYLISIAFSGSISRVGHFTERWSWGYRNKRIKNIALTKCCSTASTNDKITFWVSHFVTHRAGVSSSWHIRHPNLNQMPSIKDNVCRSICSSASEICSYFLTSSILPEFQSHSIESFGSARLFSSSTTSSFSRE